MTSNMRKEKFPLEKWDYPKNIIKTLKPITELIRNKFLLLAEKEIALLVLNILDKIENNKISPKDGDDYFTLLYLYVSDNFPKLKFSEDITNLIFEGMILHDLGQSYGANIDLMKTLAKKIIERK
jgi:hypothetical protein